MSTAAIEEQSFESILASLSEPLPDTVIRQRVGWRDHSGEDQWIDYIDWHTAADTLDRVCPDWSHEVRDVTAVGDLVAVTAAITIKGITRCGIGVGSALDEKGIKGAEHDALKRAAVKFGLARSLYSGSTRRKKSSGTDAQQKADANLDRATDKQLAAIYAIAKAKSLDEQLESMALFRCAPEQLTRASASELIDHLRNVRISA
jgi:Rad52/22 family double-strand break repair protein